MPLLRRRLLPWLALLLLPLACVDPEDILMRGRINVLIVDGTLNNLAEEQLIRLSRSVADPLSGRLGTQLITKARVVVVVDSAQQVVGEETIDGTYRLPNDFRGQVGHAYQLRITLSDGTQYSSSQQLMQAVPPILRVKAQFNPRGLSPPLNSGAFTAGHDLYVDVQDDPKAHNYYRWDWKLYEKTQWCRSCYQGIYSIYKVDITLVNTGIYYYVYTSDNQNLFEDCVYERLPPQPGAPDRIPDYTYDYPCRSECWQIIYSSAINLFDDTYANGGLLTNRPVAQIPFYDHNPALVELRQSSLTANAYSYFRRFQEQTQNTGGLADTPPTVLAGNVHNLANAQEVVVGYFTASAVAINSYWLDRRDATGASLGSSGPDGYGNQAGSELFYALNLRQPIPEPSPPFQPNIYLVNSPPRPPTALCRPSDSMTPFKPRGWRD